MKGTALIGLFTGFSGIQQITTHGENIPLRPDRCVTDSTKGS